MTPLLEVLDVTKRFGRLKALDGISFQARPGEIVGLIGPNGAGKSTAQAIICGELLADRGRVRIAGSEVSAANMKAHRQVGHVPQRIVLFPFLTANEILALAAELSGLTPAAGRERAAKLLDALELSEHSDRLAREYSEGMARKLAIAVALVGAPPLLLLDESLNGLDPQSSATVQRMIEDHAAQGNAVILTSHLLWTMERLCTKILLLHQGRLVDSLDRDALNGLRTEGRTLEDYYLTTLKSAR